MTLPDHTQAPKLHIACAMLTDIGRIRSANEDVVVFVAPAEGTPEQKAGFLALVADGMGGHAAGEVASALAADIIRRVVYSTPGDAHEVLSLAFESANRGIVDFSLDNPEAKGMGTTCTAVLIRDNHLWFAHIGDSRGYLMRDGVLEQLTEDQTLHAQLIRDGILTTAEAAVSPGGNFILQALGAREAIEPIISAPGRKLLVGDIVLLCSDGLYSFVDDDEMAAILRTATPDDACHALIARANAAGGADNISAGVFHMLCAAPDRSGGQASTTTIRAYANDSDDLDAPA